MNYYGIDYLKIKLNEKRRRVLLRYKYFDQKQHVSDLRISTPPSLRGLNTSLGWCTKAVTSMAERLTLDRFNYNGTESDILNANELFRLNNKNILTDSAILGALIAGCSFVYIKPNEEGVPSLQVIDAADATGIIDPTTGRLSEGYAVIERKAGTIGNSGIITEAYFTPEATFVIQNGEVQLLKNDSGYCLLVPIINDPDAVRPFGHSRITRACMDIVQAAQRTLKRAEVTAEYYSFPQKYITGLSDEAEEFDKYRASMSSFLAFTKDSMGDSPKLGQFSQGSASPHLDQLRMLASQFAGETGLTLDDLGYQSANPTSSEALKAGHESLRLKARKTQTRFSVGFVNVALVAASVRDGMHYLPEVAANYECSWKPVFEPDASAIASIADGLYKLAEIEGGIVSAKAIRELTGLEG